MIRLHIEPRVTKSWERFQAENPPFSIALDGYVDGPPAFSRAGPHANFDHHRQVDRLSTRSTCMQVYMAVTMGIFDTFRVDDEPHAEVYVNDPDQDTCLAYWVLREAVRGLRVTIAAPIARLLIGEDILDCTGGAYPVKTGSPFMRQQAWIFEPYVEARVAGALPTMDADGMEAVIHAVCDRISAFSNGEGEEIELDTRYDRIGGGEGWELIVEHGLHARTALFSSGVRAYVAARDNGNGTWTYTVGKMSPFVRFPVEDFYRILNGVEGHEGSGGWGGSNTIGGSPREGGSKLPPAELEKIINAVLRNEM